MMLGQKVQRLDLLVANEESDSILREKGTKSWMKNRERILCQVVKPNCGVISFVSFCSWSAGLTLSVGNTHEPSNGVFVSSVTGTVINHILGWLLLSERWEGTAIRGAVCGPRFSTLKKILGNALSATLQHSWCIVLWILSRWGPARRSAPPFNP